MNHLRISTVTDTVTDTVTSTHATAEEKKTVQEQYDGKQILDQIITSCKCANVDVGTVAFMAYDTCGEGSPIRNCVPGSALYHGVVQSFLHIPITENIRLAQIVRDCLRKQLFLTCREEGKTTIMHTSIHDCFESFNRKIMDNNQKKTMKRGKDFMTDIMLDRVGTNFRRDPALEQVKSLFYNRNLSESNGWSKVLFPIVYHLQWDVNNNPTSRPKMLFHVTFDPWATAVALAMAMCSPTPPIQVRETPYKDKNTTTTCMYQPPRKYIIDWDLYIMGNLGKAGPLEMFTEDYLLEMFIRSLAVIHMYMRILNVLPSKKDLYMSIKRRTRQTKNKEVMRKMYLFFTHTHKHTLYCLTFYWVIRIRWTPRCLYMLLFISWNQLKDTRSSSRRYWRW